MPPSFARFDATNGVFTNAIFGGNQPLKSRVCANGSYLRFRQFGSGASFATVGCSVFDAIQLIVARRIPTQIVQVIVPWVAIIVATLHALRSWAYKRFHDQFMRANNPLFVIAPDVQKWPRIVNVFRVLLNFSSLCGANAPMIRNLVKTNVPNNVFPSFHVVPHDLTMGIVA